MLIGINDLIYFDSFLLHVVVVVVVWEIVKRKLADSCQMLWEAVYHLVLKIV